MLIYEALFNVDVWLFYAINVGWANPVFDAIMPTVTNTAYWRPIYAIAFVLLLWKGGVRGRWAAITLIVMVAVFDPLSTHFLKEAIGRLRPYDALDGVRQLVASGSGSFPSNHALNNTAAAVILTHYYRKRWWIWWTITVVISLSRVYCGVHWPSDILGGVIIGAVGGYTLLHISAFLQERTRLPQP